MDASCNSLEDHLSQVHSVIALSSTIWVTVTIAKKAVKIKNQGSYLEVFSSLQFFSATFAPSRSNETNKKSL